MQECRDRAARLCPRCGGESVVRRGTERQDGQFVRDRQCKECGIVFQTLEVFSGYIKKSKKVKNP